MKRAAVALAALAPASLLLEPKAMNTRVQFLDDQFTFLSLTNAYNRTVKVEFQVPEILVDSRPAPKLAAALSKRFIAIDEDDADDPLVFPTAAKRPQYAERWRADRVEDYGLVNVSLEGTVLRNAGKFGFDSLSTLRDLTEVFPSKKKCPRRHEMSGQAAHANILQYNDWVRARAADPDGFAAPVTNPRSKLRRLQTQQVPWSEFAARKILEDQTMRIMVKRAAPPDPARRQLRQLANADIIAGLTDLKALDITLIDLQPSAPHSRIKALLDELLESTGDIIEAVEPDTRVEAAASYWKAAKPVSVINADDGETNAFAGHQCPSVNLLDESPAKYKYLASYFEKEPNSEADRLSRAPSDPLWSLQWGHQWSNLGSAWIGHRGDEEGADRPIVCVVDTGIDYTHNDLKGNVWINKQEAEGKPGVDDDGNGYVDDVYGINALSSTGDPRDDNSHGTHCAGVIAAVGDNKLGVVGVSRGAQVMACKFLGSDGGGAVSNAVKCVDYALQKGVRVLSNSWGGAGSRALREAVKRSRDKGVLFVAAAGNLAQNNDVIPTYPASYGLEFDNVISVAASDAQGRLAPFSNYGQQSVHLAAPGSNIISTVRHGAFATLSGTSMACPAVAGLAALLFSAAPNLTYQGVKAALLHGVKPRPQLQNKTIWGGIIDFNQAVESVLGNSLFRPLPNWPAWTHPELNDAVPPSDVFSSAPGFTVPPNVTFQIPFAAYGTKAGNFSSHFYVVATDPDSNTELSRERVNWDLTIWPRPQLDETLLPTDLRIPTEPMESSIPVYLPLVNVARDHNVPLNLNLTLASDHPESILSNIPLQDGKPHALRVEKTSSLMLRCAPQQSPNRTHTLVIDRMEDDKATARTEIRIACIDFEVRAVPDKLNATKTDNDILLTMTTPQCSDCGQGPPVIYLAHYVPGNLEKPVYGYRPTVWHASKEFSWVDLSTCRDNDMHVTDLRLSDSDDGFVTYKFKHESYPFHGKLYDTLIVNANGWVRFADHDVPAESFSTKSWEPQLHLSPRAPVVAAYWTDLREANVVVAESEDEVLVQWNNVYLFEDQGKQRFSIQLLLTRGGAVVMSYKDLVYEPSAQIGLASDGYRRIAPLVTLYAHLANNSFLVYSPIWSALGATPGASPMPTMPPTLSSSATDAAEDTVTTADIATANAQDGESGDDIAFAVSNDSYTIGVLDSPWTRISFRKRPLKAMGATRDTYIRIIIATPAVRHPLKIVKVHLG